MPKSINKPQCGCPINSLSQKRIENKKIDEHSSIIEITSFDIGYCEEHKVYGGKQTNYRQIRKIENNLSIVITSSEESVFKYLLYLLIFDKCISVEKFKTLLIEHKLILDKKDYDSIQIRLIQIGFIFLENIKRDIPNWKIYVSPTIEEQSRAKYAISSKERCYIDWIHLIEESISSKSAFNESENVLQNILAKEKNRLIEGNPGFYKNEIDRIVPENTFFKMNKYEIILRSLCTWLKIWKPIITVRELSARTFFQIALKYNISPSKLLEQSLSDLQCIVGYEGQSNIDNLGLIHGIKFFHYSGSMSLNQCDNKVFRSFSNLDLPQLDEKGINTPAKYILYIENLSAFMHMAKEIEKKEDWLIIYGGGKNTGFTIDVMIELLKNCKIENLFLWVDNDLGGLQILRYILSTFSKNNIGFKNIKVLYKIPNQFINYCYRKQDIAYWSAVDKEIQKHNYEIIAEIGEYIKKNGLLEQEVMLSDYKSFFNANGLNTLF